MISNFETNGVLTKKVTNYQAANVASSADLGQKELTLTSSSCTTNATAAAYPDSTNFYPYSYLKRDDRSDQENDDCCSSNERCKLSCAGNAYAHSSNGGAIKRGCEVVDGENEDDFVTMSSSSSGGGRRSPPKKPKFVVTSEEMNEFFKLLHHSEVQHFLKRDSCCLISDKYALAMVFTYFKRAKFNLSEYTLEHFYLALYLASDIEEDVDEYKYEIFPWALGSSWRSNFSGFLRKRDALLRRIGYRAIVSRKCCEEVMSFKSEHTAWKRERAEDHGGATRAYLINRSKRILSGKNDEEEMNYPRLAEEDPRPCPLCLINRGWRRDEPKSDLFIDLQTFKHTNALILPQAVPATTRPKLADLTNRSNNNNVSLLSVNDSSISETNHKTNSPKKKNAERSCAAKRQKQLAIDSNQQIVNIKELACGLSKPKPALSSSIANHENLSSASTTAATTSTSKSSKPISKTPKKSITKTYLTTATKFKHQQKQTEEIDANMLKLGALDSAKDLLTTSRIPSSHKFISSNNKIKFSAANLENNIRVFDYPRRSSLAATDKLLIKDRASDEDDDDDDDDNDDDEDDTNNSSYDDDDDDEDEDDYETTDEVFTIGNDKSKASTTTNVNIAKKHETLRLNARRSNTNKICQANVNSHGIRKRTNFSLSSTRTLKTSVSGSNSSSKLELNINSYEWQRAQVNKINDKLASREVYI